MPVESFLLRAGAKLRWHVVLGVGRDPDTVELQLRIWFTGV